MFIYLWFGFIILLGFNLLRTFSKVRRFSRNVFYPQKVWENEQNELNAQMITEDGKTTSMPKYIMNEEQMKIIKKTFYKDHSLTLIQWFKKLVKVSIISVVGVLGIFAVVFLVGNIINYMAYIVN